MCSSVSDMLISAEEALHDDNLSEAKSYLDEVASQTGGRRLPESLQRTADRLRGELYRKERLLGPVR